MKKSKKKLIIVIIIVLIIILLAIFVVPRVIKIFNGPKIDNFVTDARKIYNEARNKVNSETNKLTHISSWDDTKLSIETNNMDYCVILDDDGSVRKMAVGNETYYIILNNVTDANSIKKDIVMEGNIANFNCSMESFKTPLHCKVDENVLEPGFRYVNGQYTYVYKKQSKENFIEGKFEWEDIDANGWGVALTDRDSTFPVISKVCTTINDIPVVSMKYMFRNSKTSSIDLSSFYTRNVVNMEHMFSGISVDNLHLEELDTSNVTNMRAMFYQNKADNIDVSSFNTHSVKNMSYMFADSNVNELDLSNFNTSKVTDMEFMFKGTAVTSLDLNSFNTSNVTNMRHMFNESKATKIIFGGNFVTNNVTNMRAMFRRSLVKELDLNNFNTSEVTDMGNMFELSTTEKFNLNSFNTSKVTDMSSMFYGIKTDTLDLRKFDLKNVSNTKNMFNEAKIKNAYAKTSNDAKKLNSSVNKPSSIKFIVK